jgi:hypothetical protein
MPTKNLKGLDIGGIISACVRSDTHSSVWTPIILADGVDEPLIITAMEKLAARQIEAFGYKMSMNSHIVHLLGLQHYVAGELTRCDRLRVIMAIYMAYSVDFLEEALIAIMYAMASKGVLGSSGIVAILASMDLKARSTALTSVLNHAGMTPNLLRIILQSPEPYLPRGYISDAIEKSGAPCTKISIADMIDHVIEGLGSHASVPIAEMEGRLPSTVISNFTSASKTSPLNASISGAMIEINFARTLSLEDYTQLCLCQVPPSVLAIMSGIMWDFDCSTGTHMRALPIVLGGGKKGHMYRIIEKNEEALTELFPYSENVDYGYALTGTAPILTT